MRRRRAQLFGENFDEIFDSWEGGAPPGIRDVDDTHVVNAAKAGRVDILLTENRDDFRVSADLPFDIYSPDEFFLLIASNDPGALRRVTREQALYWHRRRETAAAPRGQSLCDALIAANCPTFAREVARQLRLLSDPDSVRHQSGDAGACG